MSKILNDDVILMFQMLQNNVSSLNHLRLSFNVVNMALICKIGISTNILVEQCVLMDMIFGNYQGVHLLEHVH